MAIVFPSDNSSPTVMDIAVAGQIADAAPRYSGSFIVETAVSAGMPVKRGTNKEKDIKPFEAADVPSASMFAGVVVFSSTAPLENSPRLVGDVVSVMRFGVIYMQFAEAVSGGEQVGITLATGALSGVPQGTAAGALATGIVVLPGLRIVQSTAAAGPARVEVNLFGSQDAATVGSL